jgi:transposase
MSSREFKRAAVLARVKAGDVAVVEAARMLDLSYRHAKRLVARYRRGGAKALVHGNSGRRSNHARPTAERTRVLALIQAHYGGGAAPGPGQRFGPTLAAEHLWDDHGVAVPVTTLCRWMREAGLWSAVRAPRHHYQRRERRAHFGELVQLDGSFHDWLEGRSREEPGRRCLMTLIDDATGTTLAQFSGEETTWGAAGVLRTWVARYGVPKALYVDAKSLYVPTPTTMERMRGATVYTQFGHMCAKLGVELIVAKTPQAKGRVERIHGTNQDRLIKKMRLADVTTYAAANTYLETHYLAAHNRRFAVHPASAVDYHTKRAGSLADRDLWCLETPRVLGNDWVVRHANQGYQVCIRGAARRYCAPGTRLLVRETEDGIVRVLVRSVDAVDGREHVLAWEPVSVPRGRGPRALPPAASAAMPLGTAPSPTATVRPDPAVSPPPAATPDTAPATRRPPTPAQLAHRMRLNASDKAFFARRRAFNEHHAQRRRESVTPSTSSTPHSLPWGQFYWFNEGDISIGG